MYFTLASVGWWLVIAFNLFLVVVVGIPMRPIAWKAWIKSLNTWKGWVRLELLYIGYHVFCWIPPIVTLIIAVSNERLGYGGKDLWYEHLFLLVLATEGINCRCTIHSGDAIIFTRQTDGTVTYTGGDPANIWNLMMLSVPILLAVFLGVVMLIIVIIFGLVVRQPTCRGSERD